MNRHILSLVAACCMTFTLSSRADDINSGGMLPPALQLHLSTVTPGEQFRNIWLEQNGHSGFITDQRAWGSNRPNDAIVFMNQAAANGHKVDFLHCWSDGSWVCSANIVRGGGPLPQDMHDHIKYALQNGQKFKNAFWSPHHTGWAVVTPNGVRRKGFPNSVTQLIAGTSQQGHSIRQLVVKPSGAAVLVTERGAAFWTGAVHPGLRDFIASAGLLKKRITAVAWNSKGFVATTE